MDQHNPLAHDLDHILSQTQSIWEELRNRQIFITGGTGFFGRWLLESFAWANYHLDLNASALVLTRNYHSFRNKMPHLATNPAIRFHTSDVRFFNFPEGEFSHIINCAARPASAWLNDKNPQLMFNTIVEGTRRTLDFAIQCRARKFIMISSGSVYGKHPQDVTHISEDYIGAPDSTDVNSAFGEGKRVAELLCTIYSDKYEIETKIARCFSFVGPYLPLDIHYAIGNFIRDGLSGGPIVVNGDGTPYRSYLYTADLIIWLLTILVNGRPGSAYNVGSDRGITIKDLAYQVSACFSHRPEVIIRQKPSPDSRPNQYVPQIRKAKTQLGLKVGTDLVTAIKKTIDFYSPGSFI